MELTPLHARDGALQELALDGFPVIDDFAVTLGAPNDGGQHIEFRSAKHGLLATFPGWDHVERDLPHFIPTDVPLGTIDEPFDDRDEAWRILIFQQDQWIHVMEAAGPKSESFHSFFRVPLVRYLEAWAALVDRFNPILPLDATE